MKKIKNKNLMSVLLVLSLVFALNITALASDTEQNLEEQSSVTTQYGDTLSVENKDIILEELGKSEAELTTEEEIALFGSGVVWNESFGDKQYSARKTLSMTASLSASTSLPYTTVKYTNRSSSPATVIAYKGTVGSTQIKVMTVYPGTTSTFTITRDNVIRYGSMNTQGTTSSLTFTISIYNVDGNSILGSVYAVKYS